MLGRPLLEKVPRAGVTGRGVLRGAGGPLYDSEQSELCRSGRNYSGSRTTQVPRLVKSLVAKLICIT